MRISDWSSDVCSSDLRPRGRRLRGDRLAELLQFQAAGRGGEGGGLRRSAADRRGRRDRRRLARRDPPARRQRRRVGPRDPGRAERKRGVWGKRVADGLAVGGGVCIKKKKKKQK